MAHKWAQMMYNAIGMHQDDAFFLTGLLCWVRSKDRNQAGHQNIDLWVCQQG